MTIGATHLQNPIKTVENTQKIQKEKPLEGNKPSQPNPVLMMADESQNLPGIDEEPVCALENRGTLYYNVDNQLQLCSGREWIHLASAGPRLDYIQEYQTVLLGSQSNDMEVFRIPGEGYFMVTAEQATVLKSATTGKKYKISTIFKWNGREFTKFQEIRSRRASTWSSFSIGKYRIGSIF